MKEGGTSTFFHLIKHRMQSSFLINKKKCRGLLKTIPRISCSAHLSQSTPLPKRVSVSRCKEIYRRKTIVAKGRGTHYAGSTVDDLMLTFRPNSNNYDRAKLLRVTVARMLELGSNKGNSVIKPWLLCFGWVPLHTLISWAREAQ